MCVDRSVGRCWLNWTGQPQTNLMTSFPQSAVAVHSPSIWCWWWPCPCPGEPLPPATPPAPGPRPFSLCDASPFSTRSVVEASISRSGDRPLLLLLLLQLLLTLLPTLLPMLMLAWRLLRLLRRRALCGRSPGRVMDESISQMYGGRSRVKTRKQSAGTGGLTRRGCPRCFRGPGRPLSSVESKKVRVG